MSTSSYSLTCMATLRRAFVCVPAVVLVALVALVLVVLVRRCLFGLTKCFVLCSSVPPPRPWEARDYSNGAMPSFF
jgi:hypothetical protein